MKIMYTNSRKNVFPVIKKRADEKDLKALNTSSSFKNRLQYSLLLLLILLLPKINMGQAPIPNEAEWSGGGYSLKKITSNITIPSGVNFSYTIMFSAPAGATSISIMDEIPTSLIVVNVPTPASVNGVTPTVTTTGTPQVNEVVNYSLIGLPSGSASSGSFTIVVQFPAGTTCDGASARNRAAILTDDWHYTPYVSTMATAVDPWKISKSILSGAVVNPNGGSCGYMIAPDGTAKYRLYVTQNSPYWGNATGQMNMSGAVVTDVLPAGATMVSSTCGATQTGNVITWNVNPTSYLLDASNPYEYYYCDIEVYYPAASFPAGTFIYNDATLSGVICNQSVTHNSNQTCVEVIDYTPNLSANFKKYISLANRVPGCTGIYTIVFCNNGTGPLSAFDINDAVPAGVTVDQIKIYNANATTTVDLNINSSPLATGINSYYDSGTLSSVNNIQLQMTGTLPVGNCLYMYVYFTVNSNPTGTVVTNCASFDGLANPLTLSDACVSFTVEAGEPKPCLIKDICSPQTDYEPGDILRFRVRVQNIGSADLTGATLQDMLHSNFNYLGNESYYVATNYNPSCSSGGGIPVGTTPWSGVNPMHSGNNLSWTLPDIPSDCQLFYSAYCGTYGTSALPYYFIEFDVEVDSTALPGVTPNSYDISGGNLPSTVTSNTVNVLVVASFGQEVEKQVSTDGGSSFSSSGVVSPGGSARYRLNYKNTSNVPVTSINLVDLLPLNDGPTDDWLILNRTVPRGSSFGVTYNNAHSTALLPGGSITSPSPNYSPGNSICLPIFGYSPGGCTPPAWSGSPDQNIKIDYSSLVLGSNVKLMEEFDVLIPANAAIQQTACNDFAAISTTDFLLDGTPQSISLTPIAAPPICITVDSISSSPCCDSVQVEQVSDPTGQGECCVRIITDCKVKAIEVSVSNGIISSASWNCGALPSGFVGQSSFTFAASGCMVDMTNCFTPDQPGTVTVTYTINFENGEVCKETIELDCGVIPTDCCDSLIVEAYNNPDLGGECCARLVSECEVDSVLVTIANGTFASASWNCGTIPAGYIGQSSYTFDANLCPVDLVTCVNPDQTGVVSISYLVYFNNGEKCEKYIKLECEAESCCDSIKVRQVVDAAGVAQCCTELLTKCEVDSVLVNISNGTFSSNTWNCGTTIPAAAIGQSSYMFVADNCEVNMVNCIDADQSGVVSVNYLIYFANGETCEKGIEIECKAKSCCDSIILEKVQKDGECCARLETTCEVESVEVIVGNGVLSSVAWNCGPIPSGYIGQSSYTFNANGCVVDMTTCVSPTQSGIVTITYVTTFMNGEVCKEAIELDCPIVNAPCCAEVDLTLKPKWPWWNNLNGVFNIANLDPSVPICYVELAYSPSASMTTGNLYIDGVLSTQSWNPTRIPATGNFSPAAINDINFN
ncbi:MAG: hypothetical protein DRJ01_12545, partial [Bacteroidetes bacterium]